MNSAKVPLCSQCEHHFTCKLYFDREQKYNGTICARAPTDVVELAVTLTCALVAIIIAAIVIIKCWKIEKKKQKKKAERDYIMTGIKQLPSNAVARGDTMGFAAKKIILTNGRFCHKV